MRFRNPIYKTLCLAALIIGAILGLGSCRTTDHSVGVGVAANFTQPAKLIAQLFEQVSGDKVALSFGSTGQLYAQVTQGAPFEVFLAADQAAPAKAVSAGLAEQSGVFTYAIGRLVLYSNRLDLTNGAEVLRGGRFDKIAIANPAISPYGAATVEAMRSLGAYDQLSGKIVQGNDVTQAFTFIESGNAEVGFVALSQVVGKDAKSVWLVPDSLYPPIRQDAVLLNKGAHDRAARAFFAFLKSPEAAAIVKRYGYRTAP